VTSFSLSSTSDVIDFDHNWHHLCSTSAGGENLSNNTLIRVIGPMEPEICTKMLNKSSDAFSEFFKLGASPVEGPSLQQKEKKWSKRTGEK